MTTFRRLVRLPLFTLALAGCAQPQAAEPTPDAEPVAVVVVPDKPAPKPQPQPPVPPPQPKAQPPAPPAPPPTFPFTADLAGKAIARAVTPNTARPLTAERFGTAPKPRVVPAKLLDPDATTRAKYIPPPILLARPVSPKPAAPPESVPPTLGAGADAVPAKPLLPVAAVVTERARDVNLPPAAPTLGRPVTDRVSLNDPTREVGNAAVTAETVTVPPAAPGFLKVVVPDPFELGAQVKPAVPPTAEPSAAPVTVDPRRVK